jgi:pilus assembly protein CpaE
MTQSKIVAVGAPPTFRFQVARAVQTDPEAVEWMPTVTAAEAYIGDDHASPHVLVLSPNIKEPDAFGLADFVGRSSPATAVLLVRERVANLNGLLSAAMRAGIRDVIDLSRGGEELREALSRSLTWSESIRSRREEGSQAPAPGKAATTISVFSSKGGTGKTFLACNLAAAIAAKSMKDTALLDLDLGVGDVFSYFGKEPTRPLEDLMAVSEEADRDSVLELGSKLHPHLWGFASPADPAARQVSGEAMGKVVRALRGAFDYVVIDGTAAYSDPMLAAFDLSETICVIAGLDVVGLRHLSLALETLLAMGFPRERFNVVLNRADSKVGLTPEEAERVLKIRVDTMIPSSRLVPISLNQGRLLIHEVPKSDVAKAVFTLASKFAARADAPIQQRRRFGRR